MEKEIFLDKFKALFEEEDVKKITMDVRFRDINEWSSMVALYFIAMADEEYGAAVTGAQIRAAQTVRDLYEIIHSKVA